MPWYPKDEYSSYSDWLSDDNYVGPTNELAKTGKVKSKKKPEKKKETKKGCPCSYSPSASSSSTGAEV